VFGLELIDGGFDGGRRFIPFQTRLGVVPRRRLSTIIVSGP
jgi:hypothetical protein